jgi:hypothetical protein
VVVQSKKYSTPLGSVAVVATIAIEVEPVAYGTVAHVIGFGDGGVVSGPPDTPQISILSTSPKVPDGPGWSVLKCILRFGLLSASGGRSISTCPQGTTPVILSTRCMTSPSS